MKYVLSILIETHLYLAVIILASYVFERTFKLPFLLDSFRWKKSEDMAKGAALLYSFLYFLLQLVVLIYNVYIKSTAPENYAFWKWLVVATPLTVIFRRLYYQFQGRDPAKKGFHSD